MSNLNNSKNLLIVVLILLSFSSKAFVGINPELIKTNLELKVINGNTIHLKTNLFGFNKESYEIEKSYDNKNFRTVAIVFAFEADACFQPLQMKDRIVPGEKTVYYRIKKVDGEKTTYIQNKSIEVK